MYPVLVVTAKFGSASSGSLRAAALLPKARLDADSALVVSPSTSLSPIRVMMIVKDMPYRYPGEILLEFLVESSTDESTYDEGR